MFLLQAEIKDTIIQVDLLEDSFVNSNSNLLYIVLIELAIIIILLIYIRHLKKTKNVTQFEKEITEAKNSNINMADLMLNINKSNELYKVLCRKCHPDKHIGNMNQNEIEKLFQEITKNKRNFQELVKLKEIAINKYNIKID